MDTCSTACRDITCGVLQRSILFPNLFHIYVKLLESIVRQCELIFQQYTDTFKSVSHSHQNQLAPFSIFLKGLAEDKQLDDAESGRDFCDTGRERETFYRTCHLDSITFR